ncbi:MAG: peptidoglycan DD-metalloendopeptidase family protein [Pseudomonadota bacterium]|nr:peptidoglycan DD-metalloendopeptidase family protein [Pseudomonadota bacterium]
MPNQPSLFDSDLRYMLKSGPRDRPMSRRYTLFGVTALVLIMLVATWLASRPDASIDQIETSRVKHDPLGSQIAQVLDARKKATAANSATPVLTKSASPLSSLSEPPAHHEPGSDVGLWPAIKELPKITISVSLDAKAIHAAQLPSAAKVAEDIPTQSVTSSTKSDWVDIDIRPGDSLTRIFNRLKLDPAVAITIAAHRKGQVLTNLKTGPRLKILLTDRQLVELEYEKSLNSALHVKATDNGWQFNTVTRSFEVIERKVTGVIASSLFDSGLKAGLSESLLHKLMSIFEWQIDFNTDIRSGDRFAIIYEEKFLEGKKIGTGPVLAATFILSGNPQHAIRHTNSAGIVRYFSPDGISIEGKFLRSPVRNSRITSNYSLRRFHPILKTWRPHRGLDFSGRKGDSVLSTADGKVVFVGRKGDYGKTVIIKHGSKYKTLYAHLSKYGKTVRKGRSVQQGQTIGYIGSTGLSTGPHLHYELWLNGKRTNPLKLKLPRAASVHENEKTKFLRKASAFSAELKRLVGA